ncbi:hypothetical protein [Deinococcus sp. AJ005]|uniref:hypothetical protein n=1 Tax=Deinococcus sp. AJ005 TaxID=2652443 RepID=UPI00125CC2F6|nr:hypothetical protein [Deinococcus sp. AJ005]QFP75409.1 hypothetical protein DAAJ005_02185 [Deinococcus sp. AJ005]
MTKKVKRPARNDAAAVLDSTQRQRRTKGRGNGSGTVWLDESIGRYRWQITLQTLVGGRCKTLNGRARTKTGAEKAMRAALVAHDEGDLQAPDTITVERQAEIWLRRRQAVEPRTLALYRQELDYALVVIGQQRIQKVSTATLKDLVAALNRKEMAAGLGKGKPMSPRTHSKVVIRLRAVFAEAVLDGTIKVSPMNGVKRERAPQPAIAAKGRVLE